MFVKISKVSNWTVTQVYETEEFEVPDEMENSTDEEIIAYLNGSGNLDNSFKEIIDDQWGFDSEQFTIEDKEVLPPEDEGDVEYE